MSLEYRITEDDCIKILQKHLKTYNFELIEFNEQCVAGEVVGIMGGHYKLKTKVKMSDKIITNSFFVKRMTSPYEIQSQMIKDQGAYDKELFAYKTLTYLYEQCNNYKCDYLAKCYLAVKDTLFVFEDVIESGCQSLKDVVAPLDIDHLKLTLMTLAKFHAGSIIYENKKFLETGKKYRILDEYEEYFKDSVYRKEDLNYLGNSFFNTCVDAILALINVVPYFNENRNEIREKFLKSVERVNDLVKPSNKYCNVVCHGDLWNSNILFKYDKTNKPIHCIILDFQAIRYTIPAHDFLYFVRFNCGVSSEDIYEQLAKHYYKCFRDYLKRNNIDINNYIRYEEFLESIEYIKPFIIVQNVCFSTLCLLRIYNFIQKDQTLIKKFFYESRVDYCLKAYKENEFFRNVVDPAIKDLNKL